MISLRYFKNYSRLVKCYTPMKKKRLGKLLSQILILNYINMIYLGCKMAEAYLDHFLLKYCAIFLRNFQILSFTVAYKKN